MSECPETVVVNNRHFRVFGSLTHPSGRSGARGLLALTYWMDVTEQDELRKKSEENRPIVAVLMLDNYEELMKAGTEAARSSVLAQIDEKISAWVSGTQGLLCKYDRNRYLLLLTEKHYNTLLEGKFSVLDAVRSVVTEDGVAATLSIGVGKDADDYETLFKNAGLSIEMALSRGGDQVVVRNRLDFEFYGGKTKSTEKRTKVKSRVMANALGELISDASQVFIMGHKHADFDAVGAAAGVCCIARKRGKKAQIVIDMDDNAAGPILKRLAALPEYKDAFISGSDAFIKAQPGALLVVVDTNRPDFVESEQLLDTCNRVAVIDHGQIAELGAVSKVFTNPQSKIARELILPGVSAAPVFTPGGKRIRLAFNGETTQHPVVANLIMECQTPVNIVSADIREIDGKIYGQTILELPADEASAERARAWLKQDGVSYEEV